MIKQLLLISAAILIGVLIYTAGRKQKDQVSGKPENINVEEGTGSEIKSAIEGLPPADKQRVERLEAQLKDSEDAEKISLLDSLKSFWDDRRVEIAASYANRITELNSTEETHIEAAIRYFDAFRFSEDSLQSRTYVSKAIMHYEKALEYNPSNLNVKTDLGVCYAEGSDAPMKGITMLLEVVEEDPRHENAQLNLGFLSVKSGQYEKALERFNKVLELNPLKTEVYLFKAQTQMRMGNNEGAVESFQAFTEVSNDREMVMEVKKYIEQIKNK